MKTVIRRKQKIEKASRIELMIRELFESFVRKTDSEKRATLLGTDPFRN